MTNYADIYNAASEAALIKVLYTMGRETIKVSVVYQQLSVSFMHSFEHDHVVASKFSPKLSSVYSYIPYSRKIWRGI